MKSDMEDIESQTIHKETLHEEAPVVLHKGKRPVILKVCMYACMHECVSKFNKSFLYVFGRCI